MVALAAWILGRSLTAAPIISTVDGSVTGCNVVVNIYECQGTMSLDSLGSIFLALDSAGNIFLATPYGIEKVAAANGAVSLYAGGGTSVADGVPATQAAIGIMARFCVGPNGDLYIADGQGRVRKVDHSTGIISTLAGQAGVNDFNTGDGGLGTAAEMMGPSDVALGPDGALYLACTFQIRRLDLVTGIITNVVGLGSSNANGVAGSATYVNTQALSFDAFGGLVYVDQGFVVRRMDPVTGLVYTVAGQSYNPPPPFDGWRRRSGHRGASWLSRSGGIRLRRRPIYRLPRAGA